MPTLALPTGKSIHRLAGLDPVQKRMVLARHAPDGFTVELEPGCVYVVEDCIGDGKYFLLATENGARRVAWGRLAKLFPKEV